MSRRKKDKDGFNYDWYKIIVNDSRPFFLSRILQTKTKIFFAILIVMTLYFSTSYITVKNRLHQLSDVNWAQYFDQDDIRT